jgi:hypothetical protein
MLERQRETHHPPCECTTSSKQQLLHSLAEDTSHCVQQVWQELKQTQKREQHEWLRPSFAVSRICALCSPLLGSVTESTAGLVMGPADQSDLTTFTSTRVPSLLTVTDSERRTSARIWARPVGAEGGWLEGSTRAKVCSTRRCKHQLLR